MKTNGFTLLELVAVIVILALIGLLTMPLITKLINNNKDKAYNNQIINIENAAKNWGADNIYLLPDEEDETLYITLAHLKATGLIDKSIINSQTENEFLNDMKIRITYQNSGLIYEVLESSGSMTGEINLNQPTISLLGKPIISVVGTYTEPGVIAITPKGEVIDTIDYKVDDGEFQNTLPNLSVGEHTITYKVINGDYNDTITRTVIVSE